MKFFTRHCSKISWIFLVILFTAIVVTEVINWKNELSRTLARSLGEKTKKVQPESNGRLRKMSVIKKDYFFEDFEDSKAGFKTPTKTAKYPANEWNMKPKVGFKTSSKSLPKYQLNTKTQAQVPMKPKILPNPGLKLKTLHPSVRVKGLIPPGDTHYNKDCMLVPKAPVKNLRICVRKDCFLCKWMKSGKLYEETQLLAMTAAFRKYKSLQLVDIGANIGLYTLWATALGRPVLAVEMLTGNINYIQTSLQVNGLGRSDVTLVNNAVFEDHRELKPTFIRGNIGETLLNPGEVYNKQILQSKVDTSKSVVVTTICMDDLLPLLRSRSVYLKIDIEGSEHHALACAKKFFDQVDVKIVQMEWRNRINGASSEQIRKFMRDRGYRASSSVMSFKPVNINGPTVLDGNVFFIKP